MAAKKASEARPRKEKLAIYLAKDGQPAAGDLIKLEDASDAIPLSAEGIEATLYVKKERPKPPPPWTDLFTQRPEVPAGLFPATRSVGAALLVRRGSRTFALTFGTGFHLIKEVAIERDFGLRVTLSSVDPNKLRSVDKANYEDNPLNSRTQSTKEVDIFDLQMDSEMEMLYALTGISNVSVFGSHVSGRDSLTVAVEITLDSLFTVLDEAISRFDGPLPLQFEWVDNIRRVKDPEIAQVLDLYLDEDLKDPTQCVLWLGEPEVVDWEKQIGYSFDRRPNTPVLPVLSLGALMEYLTKQDRPLSVDTLRATSVHVNDSDYQSVKNWNAYRCLYAELHLDAERYMLRNGLWFQVEPDFVKKVDDYISRIASCPFALPAYDCDREDDYNKKLAQSDKTYSLMDKKNTKLGGRYDKVEFCDLIRNSSDLRHADRRTECR
ncbi:TIGR04141 family sporadically distributed protein [Rhizobacter sp. Root16D2]|uniref:TIGR04141 family sporadically distributed protein n=1 Tax=Rhizobacter sp. Root16D2 TaxID=1736479 RepID=UPI0009E9DEE1|nr:TIGR04141 family sporadically distributed protein [Rhizobacter sp. Root16D2]